MPKTRENWLRNKMTLAKFAIKLKSKTGSNAKVLEIWVHSACMWYSKDEYIFIGYSKNIHFFCDKFRLQTTGKTPISTREIAEDVARLTRAVERVKKTLCELATAPQATAEATSTDKDQYPPSRPYYEISNWKLDLAAYLKWKLL